MQITQWQPASNREPTLRVGIVLAADARTKLNLRLPDADCRILPADGGAGSAARAGSVVARLHNDRVTLSVADGPPATARSWRIEPQQAFPVESGSGFAVHGVVAGRGFHWQKHVDQTLTGALEIQPAQGGLVLVNELPLEDYLAGVITAEMSGQCPPALLAAQCVVARSWLLAFTESMHARDPFDRCNDDCCQRYQGTGDLGQTAIVAVRSTRGEVLWTDAGVVDANYSKSCGGVFELPEHVWGVSKPGLTSRVDGPADCPEQRFDPVTEATLNDYLDGDWLANTKIYCSPNVVPRTLFARYLGRVDEPADYFRWTTRFARTELEDLLRGRLPEVAGLRTLHDLRVTRRGVSGRAIEIEIVFADGTGARQTVRVPDQYRIRQALHPGFLFSSAFAVRIRRDAAGLPEQLTLRGAGWGHGAGLCQIGALGMALEGHDYGAICRHYFPTARLERVYA